MEELLSLHVYSKKKETVETDDSALALDEYWIL